jgi:hypothetical protein
MDHLADRPAGASALATAVAGLIYAVAFVLLADPLLSSLFLLLGGVLATPVLIAVGYRLTELHPVAARWGTMLALAGALGSAIHGGYDLANVVNPPVGAIPDLPNPVDPRGLLTFGVGGVGLVVLGVVMLRSRRFPAPLGYLACLNGALQLAVYLGRLIILNPANLLILVPAGVLGFVAYPLLYAWLGVHLLKAGARPGRRPVLSGPR